MSLKSSSASERHFGSLGAVLGLMLGSFWGRLELFFCCPPAKHENLDFRRPSHAKSCFSGPGGSNNQSKIGPESLLAPNLAPKASWRPLGLDFWTLLAPQNGTQRDQESKLKFEAFFVPPRSRGSMGRRHGHGPSGRGLLGSLPTVDAGFPKLCLSQCFRDLHFASLNGPNLSARLSGRIS